MVSPQIFAPDNAPKEWIKFNAKLLKRKDELPLIPPNFTTLPQISIKILKSHSFICLHMVKDPIWMTTMALYYDATIPIFHENFSNMIIKYVSQAMENHASTIFTENHHIFKMIPQIVNSGNENKSTKNRITARLCKKIGSEIVERLRKLHLGPCIKCLKCNSENIMITTCCGNLCHIPCWGDKKCVSCWECGKLGSLSDEIININHIFYGDKEFDERIMSLKGLREKREKEEKEEFQKKFLGKTDKEIDELLKIRENLKKK